MPESKNMLIPLIKEKKETLWDIRASYITEHKDIYFNKALLSVSQNAELLKLSQTKPGAQSLFMCISNALQMGLQVGAQIPQCYIVPMGPTATLIPTAEGLRSIALSKPPVLKSFIVRAVFEGENFSLDFTSGEVSHTINLKTVRGPLAGVYCMITDLDGNKSAEYMPRSGIEKIRDTHSTYYIRTKKGPWVNDFEMMCLKTATKRFLKPWAALKEGLKMAIIQDEDEAPDNRDIEDRAASILDDAIETEAVIEDEPVNKEESPDTGFKGFGNSKPKDKF